MAGGWKDPEICQMARLVQVLRGIRAVQAKRGGSISRLRLPIRTDHLRKLKTVWVRGDNPQEGRMLWAAAALCFFGFFRLGEITVPSAEAFDMGAHLSFQDILVDNITKPQALRVRLKASKTDPFRKGLDVHIGHTQDELCPVSAVLTFMVARGPGAGPFFRYWDGRPLTRAKMVKEMKEALSRAGVARVIMGTPSGKVRQLRQRSVAQRMPLP